MLVKNWEEGESSDKVIEWVLRRLMICDEKHFWFKVTLHKFLKKFLFAVTFSFHYCRMPVTSGTLHVRTVYVVAWGPSSGSAGTAGIIIMRIYIALFQ